jgi:hypothetical protein
VAASRSTKSDSPVQAREELDEQQGAGGPDEKEQEKQAKAQEKEQREELAGGKVKGSAAKAAAALQKAAADAPAAARAGTHSNAPTRGGFMDQLSRRSGADALEGHYVTIDLGDSEVQEAYKDKFGEDDDGNLNWTGNFGVYMEPQVRNPDTGIPETISVRLRDDTHALVVVPYDACYPAGPRGRS